MRVQILRVGDARICAQSKRMRDSCASVAVRKKDCGKRQKEAKFEFENIVVMGMGEPLANFDNLMAALAVFNAPDKFGFGARRITVSTCGIADRIEKLAEIGFPYRLAISLHGATDEVRSRIMPINKNIRYRP